MSIKMKVQKWGCWSSGLEIVFSTVGPLKVKNQEDFLAEVGQLNFVALLIIFIKSWGTQMNKDEKCFKYMFNFWRAWNLCLLNIWYLLTKFSASTSLWFWYNSKLNIWCSTWHVNQVEGVKMRVLIADDVLTFFSFWTKNEHKSFLKNWSGLLKRSFYWWCKKRKHFIEMRCYFYSQS